MLKTAILLGFIYKIIFILISLFCIIGANYNKKGEKMDAMSSLPPQYADGEILDVDRDLIEEPLPQQITSRTTFYQRVVLIIKALGYSKPSGLCEGFARLGMNAGLARQTVQFKDRLTHIAAVIESFVVRGETNPLTIADSFKGDLDSMSFFEVLAIAQDSDDYTYLFDRKLYPRYQGEGRSIEALNEIISSNALMELGGIQEVAAYSGIYHQLPLHMYLGYLKSAFDKSKVDAPIGMLLSHAAHMISLVYDKVLGLWMTIDINKVPNSEFISSDIERVVEFVYEGLEEEERADEDGPLIFATHIFTLKSAASTLAKEIDKWMQTSSFQRLHKLDQQFLIHSQEDLSYWLLLAIREDDEEMVSNLLDYGDIVLDVQEPGGRWTALHFAVWMKKSKFVRLLLENGASADIPNANGNTAPMLAIEYNYREILDIFSEFEESDAMLTD